MTTKPNDNRAAKTTHTEGNKMTKFLSQLRKAKTRTSFPYGREAVGVNVDAIRAKAEAFAMNNPQPRAVYLLG